MSEKVKFIMIYVVDYEHQVKHVTEMLESIYRMDETFNCRKYHDSSKIETNQIQIQVVVARDSLRGMRCHKVIYLGNNKHTDFYNYYMLPMQNVTKNYY